MTIYDIARMAGVSISTVSRVLNDKPGVKEVTRLKIKKIIEDTEFKPNEIARNLTYKKTNAIGIVMPVINSYFTYRIDAINKYCQDRGYSIILTSNYRNDSEDDIAISNLEVLYEKKVEGIIFFGTDMSREVKESILKINKEIPVVLMDQKMEGIPSVVEDNKNGSSEMMNYLVKLGHKRIALIGPPSYDEEGLKRKEVYLEVLKKNGIKIREEYIKEGRYSLKSGFEMMTDILENSKKNPTAVFCANDYMAMGAINAIVNKGYKVPEDISVAGVDDIETAGYFIPSLTTLRIDQKVYGEEAAALLLDIVEGKELEDNIKVIDLELIKRKSVIKKN